MTKIDKIQPEFLAVLLIGFFVGFRPSWQMYLAFMPLACIILTLIFDGWQDPPD